MFESIGPGRSGVAKCVRCRQRIELDEVRARAGAYADDGALISVSFHLRCAIDADPESALRLLRAYRPRFADKAAMILLAEQREREAAAERERAAKAPPIDPALLPRARVYIAGSAISAMGTVDDLLALARHYRWPSTLRAYELVVVRTGEELPPHEPDAPYVGAVFALFADARIVANQKQKLADWKAAGLRTPVLWLFSRGVKDTVSDAEITRAREALDGAGFVGDEARVCVTRKVDRAALDALVAALDESTGATRAG
jgi:hypothetical protein